MYNDTNNNVFRAKTYWPNGLSGIEVVNISLQKNWNWIVIGVFIPQPNFGDGVIVVWIWELRENTVKTFCLAF